jgi:hypothetical protein
MPKGGWREGARGKAGRKAEAYRPVLPVASKVQIEMIAWLRYGRPTTDEETSAVLAALIAEAAAAAQKES